MTVAAAVAAKPLPTSADQLGYFRFGALGDGVVLTNELGEWHHLDVPTFHALVAGALTPDDPSWSALAAKGILRTGLDLEHTASALRRRKKYVGLGPSVHVLPLSEGDARLSVAAAKDILDFAMLSTSSSLEFRLLPGPLPLDPDLLAFLLQYGTEKNRYEGKALTWRLDIDPAQLDAERAGWLVDKRVRIRAPLCNGELTAATSDGIARLFAAGKAGRREVVVEAYVPVDATTVAGITGLTAIPATLSAVGITRARVEPVLSGPGAVPADAWAAAYRQLLDAALAVPGFIEESGAQVVVRATRVDGDADPDIRSPGGVGAGLVAYDLTGHIFPSPAARGLDDDMFLLGRAGQTSYKDVTRHPTQRALALASLLEALPGFSEHWATPYLGVDPIASFRATGDLFPKLPTDAVVRARLAVVEAVFSKLVADPVAATTLRTWAS